MNRQSFIVSRLLTRWMIPASLAVGVQVFPVQSVWAQPLPPDAATQFNRVFVNRDDPQRAEKLMEILKATNSAGDLNQILLLPEWQRPAVESEKVIATNDQVKKLLYEKLKKSYRETLKSEDPNLQRAVAKQIGDAAGFGIIGEVSTAERMLPRAKILRKALADLQEDLMVPARKAGLSQRSSLLALAKIESNPKNFAKLIESLIDPANPENSVTVRRHASEALKTKAQVINVLMVAGASSQDERLSEVKREFLDVSTNLIPLAAKGLSDPDLKVRDQCIEAVQAFTDIFMDIDFLIPVREAESLLREVPDLLQERIVIIQEEIKQLEPVILALQKACPYVARQASNKSADNHGRIECLDILEDCVVIRRKLWSVEYSISGSLKRKAPDSLKFDPLPPTPETNEISANVLSNLSDADPKVRKAAAQAYEFVGGQPDWRFVGSRTVTRPTATLTAQVAATDPDQFVRWVAVRSLGHIAAYPDITVPALIERIKNDDLDVRVAAMVSLRSYGADAAMAVPAMMELVDGGDADFRIASMVTLESIGKPGALPVLPVIARNLLHPNPKVRIQTALTLGRFGSPSKVTLPELRRSLRDPDPEVRLAVSNAIMQIEGR